MSNLVDKQCKDTEWWTPESILEPVRRYFRSLGGDGIELDPATDSSNPTEAKRIYTDCDPKLDRFLGNGLTKPWQNYTFLNPPYGKVMREWLDKMRMEAERGIVMVALLPASRWEQGYFQKCVFNDNLLGFCMIRKRVKFLHPDGTVGKSNPYASILYAYNGDFSKFGDMEDIGTTVQTQHIRPYAQL